MTKQRPAAAWKALSDPTRRRLLDLLKRRPRTTGQLVKKFPRLSRFAVMKHLKVLQRASLVLVRRDGRRRWNHLNAVPIRQVYERWVSGFASHSAEALVGLKRFIEGQHEGGIAMSEPALSKAGQYSYQIEQEVLVRASRDQVFDALTRDIGKWWAFRIADKGSELTLEPRVGGRFFEDLGNGEGALWGTVMYIRRPEKIRLNGPLGISAPVVSNYIYELVEADGGTLLKLSHRIFGDVDAKVEESHRTGWGKLLNRYLKGYLEQGKRYHELDAASAN